MTNDRARATDHGWPKRPHSEDCPQHQALYLHEVIRALQKLEELPRDEWANVGFSALLTIAEERAEALYRELDDAAFAEGWPETLAMIRRNREARR